MKKTLLTAVAVFLTLAAISQAVPRQKVLFEIATGTWCVYCPGAAMGASDLIANGHDVAIIKYHSGDGFQNTYSTSRISYYGVTGYPTTKIDGTLTHVGGNANNSIYPTYLNYYNQRINVPSPFKITIYGESNGLNYNLQVLVQKFANYQANNLVLHLAVTETNIPFNWFNQTMVKDVCRLMVPTQNGTQVNFALQDYNVYNLSFTLQSSWVANNMSVVAFLQDVTTKQVFQANTIKLTDLMPATINSSFTADVTEICEGEQVEFTCTSGSGAASWFWSFPGGNPEFSIEPNLVVTYAEPGSYSVTLTVSNLVNNSTFTQENMITVNDSPETPETPVGDAVIDLYYVTVSEYSVEEVTGAMEYQWQFVPEEAGMLESDGPVATITWNPDFLGEAFLSVKAVGEGCESEFSQQLEINVTNTVGIEPVAASEFSVSPNPGNGIFMVQLPESAKRETITIRVYDLRGKVIWEEKSLRSDLQKHQINLSHLSQGVYYLSVQSPSLNISKSISIVR